MDKLTRRENGKLLYRISPSSAWRVVDRCIVGYEAIKRLAHYEDLEEQGRLIDWRKTAEEKPDSTRHLIVADGEIISHYGYYLKPKDKWFTNWKCEEEISAPIFWADMPEPPKESLHSDCGVKMESEVAE